MRTGPYLTTGRRDRYLLAISYSLLSLALGLWGIPWGPILTARAIWANLSSRGDVTEHLTAQLRDELTGQFDPGSRE